MYIDRSGRKTVCWRERVYLTGNSALERNKTHLSTK